MNFFFFLPKKVSKVLGIFLKDERISHKHSSRVEKNIENTKVQITYFLLQGFMPDTFRKYRVTIELHCYSITLQRRCFRRQKC